MTNSQELRLIAIVKTLAETAIDLNKIAKEIGSDNMIAAISIVNINDDILKIGSKLQTIVQVNQMKEAVNDYAKEKLETT